MKAIELKLKQASAVLGVPPKDLQNLVQLKVVRPPRRNGIYWLDYSLLLQAKVAFYLKKSLGSSSDLLSRFIEALSSYLLDIKSGKLTDITLCCRATVSHDPVEVKIPLRSLADELDEALPRASVRRDLPRGRRRPGWKEEFLQVAQMISAQLGDISEEQILKTIREYRSERKKLPEISIVARSKKKTA